jgi:hypothetical protein
MIAFAAALRLQQPDPCATPQTGDFTVRPRWNLAALARPAAPAKA